MVPSSQFSASSLDRISRRRVLSVSLASVLLAQMRLAQGQSPSRTMQQPIGIELLETRLKMELEVEGEARLGEGKDKTAAGAPLKSKATQDYLETIAFRDDEQVAAARHYFSAQAENWVSGKSVRQTLRAESANTRTVRSDGSWEQFSPNQPLEAREVSLLQTPINTLALEKLLPVEPARADSKWTIAAEDARDIFNLDAVHRSTLNARIVAVEKGVAKFAFEGQLQASANSVSTELHVKGNAHVIMGSQCAIVNWLGLSIKETRAISESQPGFNVVARLQLARQELPGKLKVSRNELLAIADTTSPGNWLVHMESACRFTLLASRKWIMYLDSGEDAVLRYVDNNKVVAQCNIVRLPNLDTGSQLTLEGLQVDIKQSLGKSFREFLETSERVTGSKLRLVRAEAAGMQEDVPIHWIYAHLSDDSGRRLALVFTLAAEYAESFSGQDMQLIDSLEFLEIPASATETGGQSATETAKLPAGSSVK